MVVFHNFCRIAQASRVHRTRSVSVIDNIQQVLYGQIRNSKTCLYVCCHSGVRYCCEICDNDDDSYINDNDFHSCKKCCRRWYREKIWSWMTTAQSKTWNNLALRYSRRLWRVEALSVAVHYSSEPRDCSPWRDSAMMTYLLHCLPNQQGNSSARTFRRDFMRNAWWWTEHSIIHCQAKKLTPYYIFNNYQQIWSGIKWLYFK